MNNVCFSSHKAPYATIDKLLSKLNNRYMKWLQLTPQSIERKSRKSQHKGCWLWGSYCQSSGYGQIRIEGKRILAHRLSWILHFGDIPEGLLVCHTCDVRRCVNPEHLYLGTQKENMQDCLKKGRTHGQTKGYAFTRKPRTRKLTPEQVQEIRDWPHEMKYIAEKLGISIACVSMIKSGKRKKATTP
jgi:HNH endonuclease